MSEEKKPPTKEQAQLTAEEEAELAKWIQTNAPQPEQQYNVHRFLHEVADSDDTTKTGFLTKEELGEPKLPLRTVKELALFCEEIAGMPEFAEYFRKEAEIITATSLSKEAKLLELAVVVRRELADVTKAKKENKAWFKKKEKTE